MRSCAIMPLAKCTVRTSPSIRESVSTGANSVCGWPTRRSAFQAGSMPVSITISLRMDAMVSPSLRGRRGGPQWPEEFAQIGGEQIGFLERREVAAARHRAPAPDVEEALGPFARRARQILGKQGERRRHLGGRARPLLE